ncbi:MAG TPA: ROK family protein [Ktedonobacteraceae bacterium]|nr:ROK family protein [Ktedonobacteraceae bacterium]
MSTEKRAAVSVEIAESGTTVALIDGRGSVMQRSRAKTLWGRPALATLEPYVHAIETMLRYADLEGVKVSGIGICVPGSVDVAERRPLMVPSLPSLNSFPVCDFLEARYDLPTQLHVDVDAALLGEHYFGVGKGFRRVLFLTITTVVGAAFVHNGRLERTTQQYVGHICHLLLSPNGPRCSCGKRGCINTMISITAMQKMVQRALRRGEETSLTQRLLNREYFSPQLLAEEAGRGDAVALQVYGEVGRWLSAATGKYLTLFEPHMIILGGDVLSASDLLLPQVRNTIMVHSATNTLNATEVVAARLGADAALIGAVAQLF